MVTLETGSWQERVRNKEREGERKRQSMKERWLIPLLTVGKLGRGKV